MVRPGRFSSWLSCGGVLYSIANWKNVLFAFAYGLHVWIKLR